MVNPDRNLYEPPYDDALLYDSDLEPERPRSRPLIVLLGIVVLAAFAGVVWVAYNQGIKQGQGGIPPILSADAGPTRIVPDAAIDTQGANPAPDKSYERLWGEAPATDGQENVLPQPEQPRTVPASPDIAPPTAAAPDRAIGGPLETKATDLTPPSAASPSADPRMDATVGISGGSARPLTSPSLTQPGGSEDITSALPTETPIVPATPKPITAPIITTPKVATSSKPSVVQTTPSGTPAGAPTSLSKPAAPKVTPPAPVQPEATELAAVEPPPAPAPSSGSIMIQLGSFPSDALAASSWSKIKSANVDLLGSYSPSIKSAEIPGKGTWYRLRVGGFADKSAASEVCQQLVANGQACIVAGK